MNLRRRLAEVPNFDEHLAEMDDDEAENEETLDPVSLMWNCLRRGYPLMTIYNALRPRDPLEVDPNKVKKSQVGKAATFKFLQACMEHLKIPAAECFLITDLYGEDTTGFVKVRSSYSRPIKYCTPTIRLARTTLVISAATKAVNLLKNLADSLPGNEISQQGSGHSKKQGVISLQGTNGEHFDAECTSDAS